jgi:hypothetical protein
VDSMRSKRILWEEEKMNDKRESCIDFSRLFTLDTCLVSRLARCSLFLQELMYVGILRAFVGIGLSLSVTKVD